jgi:hypothetical protein
MKTAKTLIRPRLRRSIDLRGYVLWNAGEMLWHEALKHSLEAFLLWLIWNERSGEGHDIFSERYIPIASA